jgi:hypothetical protein
MLVPSLVYVALNAGTHTTLRGRAVPAANDIAFALGILAPLGLRAPVSLKVFLTALAILDDLGAVLIIALFYAADLSAPPLGGTAQVEYRTGDDGSLLGGAAGAVAVRRQSRHGLLAETKEWRGPNGGKRDHRQRPH